MRAPHFALTTFHEGRLAAGATDVDAIVEVRSSGAFTPGERPAAVAVVIVVDCSASMDDPAEKIVAVRRATRAALDALPDGVLVAVVAGRHDARMVFPRAEHLAVLDAPARHAAGAEIDRLAPSGGTAIGAWLDLTRRLLVPHPERVRHALLLTDGRDEHETPERLDEALAACEGVFTCDARGIGTGWEVEEVRRVATRLLGTADIVADPAGLDADLTGLAERAVARRVGAVALRVWTPRGATVSTLKQVAPTLVDLTDRRGPDPEKAQVGHYPTGAWGDETREYHLRVALPAHPAGQELLAARVAVTVAGEPVSEGRVVVAWTADRARSTRVEPRVRHYTGQAELAAAIRDGLEARRAGDVATATAQLARARELALDTGHAPSADLLEKIVEVDPATGRVRLRGAVSRVDEMTLDVQSTRTTHVVRRREDR